MTETVLQALLIGVVATAAGVVLLGYRDRARVDMSDQLTVLLSIFVGVAVAMVWELLQFILDWTLNTDLQPSNLDSMVELLWSDIAAVVGAVLAARLYCHALNAERRAAVGNFGVWLFSGPSRLLDRHGFAITLVFTALAVLAVGALWFTGRPIPGFPVG